MSLAGFVAVRSPIEAWQDNWTFVCLQLTFLALASVAFLHAVRSGRRAIFLCLTAVGHGLFVEGVCYAVPSLDNFWHGRAVVALFWGRMPLYVVILYPAFYYTAAQLATAVLAAAGIAPALPELQAPKEAVHASEQDDENDDEPLANDDGGVEEDDQDTAAAAPESPVSDVTRRRARPRSSSSSTRNALRTAQPSSTGKGLHTGSAEAVPGGTNSKSHLLLVALVTGLLTALIDIPYDTLGPKLLHWSWHDTDPNVFERAGPFVPLTSYLFHVTFAGSWLLAGVAAWRWLVDPLPTHSALRLPAALAALVLGSVLPFLLGALQIQAFYVGLHDALCVPTSTCLLLGLVVTAALAAVLARNAPSHTRRAPDSGRVRLLTALQAFALVFVVLAALADPATLRDTGGIHQPLALTEAQCEEVVDMVSLTGTVHKNERICLAGAEELSDAAALTSDAPMPTQLPDDPATPSERVLTPKAPNRDRFDARPQCLMERQPLPFRVVLPVAECGADGLQGGCLEGRWTMAGTPWGQEGAGSNHAAMFLAASIPAAVVIAIAQVVKQH